MNTTEFVYEGVEYIVVEFPNIHRVQLQQRRPNAKWEVAAETYVPEGESMTAAALRMKFLVTGEDDPDTALPA